MSDPKRLDVHPILSHGLAPRAVGAQSKTHAASKVVSIWPSEIHFEITFGLHFVLVAPGRHGIFSETQE